MRLRTGVRRSSVLEQIGSTPIQRLPIWTCGDRRKLPTVGKFLLTPLSLPAAPPQFSFWRSYFSSMVQWATVQTGQHQRRDRAIANDEKTSSKVADRRQRSHFFEVISISFPQSDLDVMR
jgi:hypothetical protein